MGEEQVDSRLSLGYQWNIKKKGLARFELSSPSPFTYGYNRCLCLLGKRLPQLRHEDVTRTIANRWLYYSRPAERHCFTNDYALNRKRHVVGNQCMTFHPCDILPRDLRHTGGKNRHYFERQSRNCTPIYLQRAPVMFQWLAIFTNRCLLVRTSISMYLHLSSSRSLSPSPALSLSLSL